MFELLSRDGLARVGRFETAHGSLHTPALLPVVNPSMMTISPRELHDRFGFRGLITNAYIIRNDEVLRRRALEEGLHALLDFPGVIMTDSGTFQSHMYGEVDVDNLEIVEFQRSIGSDVGTVLDIFTEPDWGRRRAEEGAEVTLQRTREAAGIRGEMKLAGVVQGSVFPDLRERCARELAGMEVDLHPIGGVVPLMESYRFAELVDVIIASKKGLDPSRPVHLFGAGHPMLFSLAALLGCDLFDSASYAKFARDKRMMFTDGTSHLETIRYLDCRCPACASITLDSLREMDEGERTATIAAHNLYVCQQEIERVKRAIMEGDLWELVERRCRAHPRLLDGVRRLESYRDFLEHFEPLSRDTAFLYTGPESLGRPAVHRFRKRVLERFPLDGRRIMVEVEGAGKPYSRSIPAVLSAYSARAQFVIANPLGPVPIELDEIYPVAQSIMPETMDTDAMFCTEETISKLEGSFETRIGWDLVGESLRTDPRDDYDLRKVRCVADYQFGRGASELLLKGEVSISKSRTTGKIRTVSVDGDHVLSMRAHDGFFTLKPEGARRLIEGIDPPGLRVVVHDDSVPFNREGRNVFCGFVLDSDPGLRPMDEVVVVDSEDRIAAIGRALLTREEMLSFGKGLAVRVRQGVRE